MENLIDLEGAMNICNNLLDSFDSKDRSITHDEFLIMCEEALNKYKEDIKCN